MPNLGKKFIIRDPDVADTSIGSTLDDIALDLKRAIAELEALRVELKPGWKRRQLRLDRRDDAIIALASSIDAPTGRKLAKKVQDRLARPAGDALAHLAAELCDGKVLSVRQITAILGGTRQ
jgi:hypothetical protein